MSALDDVSAALTTHNFQSDAPDAPDSPYWVWSSDPTDRNMPYGIDTVGIVDEREGGVILYCHRVNVASILAALEAAL